jgi:tetratricopeptide (TPR) repeat protein
VTFAGRVGELARLTALLDRQAETGSTVVISAIGGAGGVGKTWLALRWAYEHLDRFPDGQLWVNLRGFDPSGEPMSAEVAIQTLLNGLGVTPAQVPDQLAAQIGLYRSLVADKRMLILFDNAANATQVIPLLPGGPACTVLVTSRDRLTGLVSAHGAHPLSLDVLSGQEARALLANRLGAQRLAEEPDAVAELLERCAGLPLALSIVAGYALSYPEFRLSVLAGQLRDETTRLAGFDEDPVTGVRAVLSWSYRALTAEHAEALGLLGLAPGPDIGVPAAASLLGRGVEETIMLLRGLERVSLITQYCQSRYRIHDLIRLYAAERAARDLAEDLTRQALTRLLDFAVHAALLADQTISPTRQLIDLGQLDARAQPQSFGDKQAAADWFDVEHAGLLAMQRLAVRRGWHARVWQLAWLLTTFQRWRGYLSESVACCRAALAAALALDDPAAQALAHRILGAALSRSGDNAEALDHHLLALAAAERTGDLVAQAHTHHTIAHTWELLGDNDKALVHATEALRRYQTIGERNWEAQALNAVGWYCAQLDRYDQAHASCTAALELFRRDSMREGEAATLDSLGYLARRTGAHTEALAYYQQALDLRHDLGNAVAEADTLDHLGETWLALGDRERARTSWAAAETMFREQHRTAARERVQRSLERLADKP